MKHHGTNPYQGGDGTFRGGLREFWFDLTHPRQMARRMREGLPEAWREFQEVMGRR